MTFDKRSPRVLIKLYCKFSLLLNILSIAFIIAYLVIPIYSNITSIAGFIIFGAWLMNLFLLYIVNEYIIKDNLIGQRINKISYYYIIFFIIAILLILIALLTLNLVIKGNELFLGKIVYYLNISVGGIGISAIGSYFALLISASLNKRGVWNFGR
ncbi:MAG: hypothetical protein ACTSVV_03375 [Promethearchaeota archaeon]